MFTFPLYTHMRFWQCRKIKMVCTSSRPSKYSALKGVQWLLHIYPWSSRNKSQPMGSSVNMHINVSPKLIQCASRSRESDGGSACLGVSEVLLWTCDSDDVINRIIISFCMTILPLRRDFQGQPSLSLRSLTHLWQGDPISPLPPTFHSLTETGQYIRNCPWIYT